MDIDDQVSYDRDPTKLKSDIVRLKFNYLINDFKKNVPN